MPPFSFFVGELMTHFVVKFFFGCGSAGLGSLTFIHSVARYASYLHW
jgi:hypothetical protein